MNPADAPNLALRSLHVLYKTFSPYLSRLLGSQDWDKISSDDIDGWEPTGPPTPLLDTVSYPVHMKNFNNEQLRQLCREIRSDLIHTVSQTGGHLGASLGVVELTVALHKVQGDPTCYGHFCMPLHALHPCWRACWAALQAAYWRM